MEKTTESYFSFISLAMAMPTRTLTRHPHTLDLTSLATALTSCLQTLNPQNPKPSHISPAPLNKFSPFLDPNLVIQVIKKQTNPYHAVFFFNWASNPYPNPNNYTHTDQCYVAITDLLLSHSLFSTVTSLLKQSNRLSDFFVSKLITAHGCRGNIKGAIFWFNKAKRIENGKCLFSCNAILGVLVKANLINLAKSIFDQIVKDAAVKPDSSTYNTMIRGFCKMRLIDDARKLFDEMICTPDLLTYNTMINGYCKKGDMENAIILFNQMLVSPNCFPDTITYTTLIDGYCKKGEFDEAMKLMNDMFVRGRKPNLLTYNAIIYGLCLRGNVDEAKRLITKMRLENVSENVATHASILKGLYIAERPDEAVNYFREMIRKGMKPDAKVHGVVVNEYCKMRKPDEAISILKEMYAKGISPGVWNFNAVFRILQEFGELDKAILLLKQMRDMGCPPNSRSYFTVICSLCRAKGRMQEVEELVNEMLRDGLEIDSMMYSCLVEGYCEDGNEEMAMRVFYETTDKNYVIKLDSFSVFVSQLCKKGKFVEAEKIFGEMCRRCSVIDVDSYQMVLDQQLCMHFRKGWGELDMARLWNSSMALGPNESQEEGILLWDQ